MFFIFLALCAIELVASGVHNTGLSGVSISRVAGVDVSNGRLTLAPDIRTGTVEFSGFNIGVGETLTCGRNAASTSDSHRMILRSRSGMTVAGTLAADGIDLILHSTNISIPGMISATQGNRVVLFMQESPSALLDVMLETLAGDVSNLQGLAQSEAARVVWPGRDSGTAPTAHVSGEVYVHSQSLPNNISELVASGQSLTLVTPGDGGTPFFIVAGAGHSAALADTFGGSVIQILSNDDGTLLLSDDGEFSVEVDDLPDLTLDTLATTYAETVGVSNVQFGYLSDGVVTVPTVEQFEAAVTNLGLDAGVVDFGAPTAALADYYNLDFKKPLVDYSLYAAVSGRTSAKLPTALVANFDASQLISDIGDLSPSVGLEAGPLAPTLIGDAGPLASVEAPAAEGANPTTAQELTADVRQPKGTPAQEALQDRPGGSVEKVEPVGVQASVGGNAVQIDSQADLLQAIEAAGGADNFVAENPDLVATYPGGGAEGFLNDFS